MCDPCICTLPGRPLTASSGIQMPKYYLWHENRNPDPNIHIFRHTWRHWHLTLDSILGQPDPYLDSLRIISRLPPKDRILLLISKLNIITDKIRQVEIYKTILMICLKIWRWTSWSRIQVVQLNFWLEIWNSDPINLYLDIHEDIKCLPLESIPGRCNPYLESLQRPPDQLQIASKQQNIVINI